MDKDRQDQIIKDRQRMMDEHGWIVDAVFDGKETKCDTGTGVDIHTHGIQESFGHMDLQCVLPIDTKVAHSIFCTVVDKIKEGEKFEAGKCYGGLVGNNYKLRFMLAKEGDREVLRIILPDKKGKLHKSLIEESFRVQYNGI